MVRTLIKGLLVLLVVVGALPFILPLKDGRPLLSLDDLKTPSLPELPQVHVTAFEDDGKAATEVTVYRWKNDDGEWSYSNEAPPPDLAYETITTDIGDTGVGAEQVPTARRTEEESQTPPTAPEMPSPYSPEQVKKLLEDAQGVQTLLDDRKKRLDGEI